MSSAHNVLTVLQNAEFLIRDPGASGAIKVTHNFGFVPLVTLAAETRTLAAPVRGGQQLTLVMMTDGGDCTVTVASAYDETGGTTLVFANTGEYITLHSVPVSISSGVKTYAWRVLTVDGVVGPTLTVAGTGLLATGAEINRTSDASARIVNVAAAATALSLTAVLHAERIVLVPLITGAGLTITLPAATGTGNKYHVINNGIQTVALTVTALAGDIMFGKSIGFSQTVAASGDIFVPTAADIKYTFNITTTGGDGGDELIAIDIATDQWWVDVMFHGSSTVDTGFA